MSEQRLAADLETLRVQLGIPGLSAAVGRNGRLLWARGFGTADLEKKTPTDAHTVYPLASISKPLSSFLLSRLVHDGRLDLDAPSQNYPGGIADGRVHVRHLLTHTSESEPPGQSFRYNHSRFRLLTSVLESAAGERIERLFIEDIFDPLHLIDTIPGNDPMEWMVALGPLWDDAHRHLFEDALLRCTSLYRTGADGKPVLSCYTPEPMSTSGGVWSSVVDLVRFGMALDDDAFLSPEDRTKMFSPPVASDGKPLPYANGWFVTVVNGRRLVWHYGYLPGLASGFVIKDPVAKLTFALLANSDALAAPVNEALIQGNIAASPFVDAFLQDYPRPAELSSPPRFDGKTVPSRVN